MSDISVTVGVASLIASVVSIILAGVAIWFTYHTSQSTRALLAEVDKKAAIIEGVAKASQEKLLDTVTSIAAPKEPNQEQQLMNLLVSNPGAFNDLLQIASGFGAFTQTQPQVRTDEEDTSP